MIQISGINLAFNNKKIFDNLSFMIDENEKIGLVGLNGSGKTTFLKAISNPKILDSGSIVIQSKKKIAYLPQEVVLESNLSILDETFSVFSDLNDIQNQIKKIEVILESGKEFEDDLIEKYANLQEKLANSNPDALKAKTKKILSGLGFKIEQFDEPVEILSVGWKMRVVLAKLLLKEADFYLFDEPTNHLDIIAKEWFLNFLKTSNFGFILICHERYFLDELCEKILEFDGGKGRFYKGNYSDFIVKKEADLAILHSSYVQQQKEIEQKKKIIDKFKSGTRAKQAQSMMKALDRIDVIEIPHSQKTINFNFPPVQESGKLVLKVSNLSHSFDNKKIFENISFEIMKKQKVAIIAPNGAGKTTLFNLITGHLQKQKGTVEFGFNVTNAIFAQDQSKELKMNLSVMDNLKNICATATEQKIRSFLGSFLFQGSDAYKKTSVLSGGEKNRVGMVGVLLQNANLLLLDEPTNHLDIPSKEILLKALKEFTGTLIFISHDRDFVDDLATNIIELTDKKANCFAGSYSDYIYQKEALEKKSLIR